MSVSWVTEVRHEVARVVTAGGGVFSSDLSKEAGTHLIAQSPSGEQSVKKVSVATL